MRRPGLVTVVLIGAVVLGACLAPPAAAAPGNESAHVTAVYPNPVASEDAGEFVTLGVEEPTRLGRYSLSDGETTVELPDTTVDDRVTLSGAPGRARNTSSHHVVGVVGFPRLANGGERLVLHRNGTVVDSVRYADAPEGELGRRVSGGLDWRPVGRSDFPVVRSGTDTVRAFVLPDAAGVPLGTLERAEERVLLAGYTLTSRRVVEALVNASDRGVTVRVLVDGEPVGGMTGREARLLDRLVAANASVRVLGGEGAPYAFHHAKYAVVDGRALVTTENWKPAGTGGHASRGWGVVVDDRRTVRALAGTFRTDATGPGVRRWRTVRADGALDTAEAAPANGTYPRRLAPTTVAVDGVEVVRAPDNAEGRVVAMLANATESVRVQQVSVGSRRQPFLRAAMRAARRGVEVRILLSDAWYVREDNRALVTWLNRRADRRNLPLSARLADPNGRYGKIHAKGVVVDGEHVLVGSLNWNNHSARENREVALLLHGSAVGRYYRRVFRADWRGGVWLLPVGLLASTLLVTLLAVVVARRIDFEDSPPEGP